MEFKKKSVIHNLIIFCVDTFSVFRLLDQGFKTENINEFQKHFRRSNTLLQVKSFWFVLNNIRI